MIKNFLNETLAEISELNFTPEDIVFIGSLDSGYCCTWGEFKKLADRKYDDSTGWQIIPEDLVIVFSDNSRLFRSFDGYCRFEYWSYMEAKAIPKNKISIHTLFIDGMADQTLEYVNTYIELS